MVKSRRKGKRSAQAQTQPTVPVQQPFVFSQPTATTTQWLDLYMSHAVLWESGRVLRPTSVFVEVVAQTAGTFQLSISDAHGDELFASRPIAVGVGVRTFTFKVRKSQDYRDVTTIAGDALVRVKTGSTFTGLFSGLFRYSVRETLPPP